MPGNTGRTRGRSNTATNGKWGERSPGGLRRGALTCRFALSVSVVGLHASGNFSVPRSCPVKRLWSLLVVRFLVFIMSVTAVDPIEYGDAREEV